MVGIIGLFFFLLGKYFLIHGTVNSVLHEITRMFLNYTPQLYLLALATNILDLA